MFLGRAGFHWVLGGKGGRSSKASAHSSGSGGPVSRCRSRLQCASSSLRCAAGPPLSAASHLREPV
eukprot:8031163-Lingulodinium_polyedra.AAC.1